MEQAVFFGFLIIIASFFVALVFDTQYNDKKEITILFTCFFIGLALFFFGAMKFGMEEGYEDGQKDALSGKQQYKTEIKLKKIPHTQKQRINHVR